MTHIRHYGRALLACALFSAGGNAIAADDLTQPIHVSPDGHFLVQPDGKPFFWLQDWGYELFKMPDRNEVDRYFDDRSRKGFTIIMAPVTGILGALTRPNRYGELPFIDCDPLRPNPRYFENVDWIVGRAARYGLRLALLPTWGQPVTGGFEKGPRPFTPSNAEHYGRWLAARYRHQGILWGLGGDVNPRFPQDVATLDQFARNIRRDTPWSTTIVDYTAIFDGFAKGILDGSGGEAFITYHPTSFNWSGTPHPRTSLYLGDRSWLDMNMIQSGHHMFPEEYVRAVKGVDGMWKASFNYEPINDEYHSKPTRPVIDAEPRYENESINLNRENGYWKTYDVRNAAYHALFAGAAGIAYADVNTGMLRPELRPLLLDMTPGRALASPGSTQMQHAKALMLSRPYFTRIPDQSVIVGDAGRGEPHIAGTRDREGSYAMVYLPHGQKVTVDMSKISGKTAVAWWFDPRTGDATRIDGQFPTSGPRMFEPPTSGADTDWILVLDDASRGFPPPGITNAQPGGGRQPLPAESQGTTVDADGIVRLPAMDVPLSSAMSEQAKARYLEYARTDHPLAARTQAHSILELRRVYDNYFRPLVERGKALYPVNIEERTIAGVRTAVVTPKQGVSAHNRARVLINLHGGGLHMGAGLGGLAESIPIASTGKITVISVDYRMAPEFQFPAASEDVTAVYRALLRKYKPQNIGIYGWSCGGLLAAEAVAWFQAHALPKPGAIGLIGGGGVDAAFGGDSRYVTALLEWFGRGPPIPAQPNPPPLPLPYFKNADIKDPLVSPAVSQTVLAKFPPTLLIVGSRDFLMSPSVQTHAKLVRAGVDADLHVWDGMWHYFTLEMDLPEAREAFAVITRFFDTRLGK